MFGSSLGGSSFPSILWGFMWLSCVIAVIKCICSSVVLSRRSNLMHRSLSGSIQPRSCCAAGLLSFDGVLGVCVRVAAESTEGEPGGGESPPTEPDQPAEPAEPRPAGEEHGEQGAVPRRAEALHVTTTVFWMVSAGGPYALLGALLCWRPLCSAGGPCALLGAPVLCWGPLCSAGGPCALLGAPMLCWGPLCSAGGP